MEWVAGKEFTEFIESQSNKTKRNIKMRVTLEQSIKIQEICFENGIIWTHKVRQLTNLHLPFLFICKKKGIYATLDIECYNSHTEYQEIDADLFIRTNGTCEEPIGNKFQPSDELIHSVAKYNGYDKLQDSHYTMNILLDKIKKKNEILKKAKIKRKNQREELHKLNIKLQKCISLEEHNKIIEKINKDNVNYLSNSIISRDKEIEKLKAVIEYLESKVK